MEKLGPRSCGVTNTVADIAADIAARNLAFKTDYAAIAKQASSATAPPPNKISINDYENLANLNLVDHGLGVFECSKGQIWRIVKHSDGQDFLERDEELTEENSLVDQLILGKSSTNPVEV